MEFFNQNRGKDPVKNEEVHGIKKERNILHAIERGKPTGLVTSCA